MLFFQRAIAQLSGPDVKAKQILNKKQLFGKTNRYNKNNVFAK